MTELFSQKILQVKITKICLTFIFSDENLVEVDLQGRGIWRTPGNYSPGSFYEREAHPKSVMIWSAKS